MPMSIDDVRLYAKKMVERESRGNGDQLNAMERVARHCRMTARSLRRLISGETKDPGVRAYFSVRNAFIEQLGRQIAELQLELDTETAISKAEDLNKLDDELESLAAKVRRAKETAKRR